MTEYVRIHMETLLATKYKLSDKELEEFKGGTFAPRLYLDEQLDCNMILKVGTFQQTPEGVMKEYHNLCAKYVLFNMDDDRTECYNTLRELCQVKGIGLRTNSVEGAARRLRGMGWSLVVNDTKPAYRLYDILNPARKVVSVRVSPSKASKSLGVSRTDIKNAGVSDSKPVNAAGWYVRLSK